MGQNHELYNIWSGYESKLIFKIKFIFKLQNYRIKLNSNSKFWASGIQNRIIFNKIFGFIYIYIYIIAFILPVIMGIRIYPPIYRSLAGNIGKCRH